jgi:hypothetical protein
MVMNLNWGGYEMFEFDPEETMAGSKIVQFVQGPRFD